MQTATSTTTATQRTKTLVTNLNGKLTSQFFCHIDIAGSVGIPESQLDRLVYTFTTLDGSHPPIRCRLIDSCRQPLNEISEAFTMLSHGLHREDFIKRVLTEVKNSSYTMPMVTYFYEKM